MCVAMTFSPSTQTALAVFVFAVTAFWGGRANAEDNDKPRYQADDLVIMTNGHEVHGHVVYEAARTVLTMWLDDGKVITIPWSEIDRVVLSPAKPPSRPPQWNVPEEKSAAPTTDDDADATVRVIFEGDDDTVLEQRDRNDRDRWRRVCTGKCTIELLLKAEYQIGGGGARTSKPFRLEGKAGDTVILNPNMHSRAALAAGITFVSVGSIGMVAAFAHSNHCEQYDYSCGNATGAWVATSVISVATSALGTVLIALNPHSKVMQHLGEGSPSMNAKTTNAPLRIAGSTMTSRAADSWRRPIPAQLASSPNTSSIFTMHF